MRERVCRLKEGSQGGGKYCLYTVTGIWATAGAILWNLEFCLSLGLLQRVPKALGKFTVHPDPPPASTSQELGQQLCAVPTLTLIPSSLPLLLTVGDIFVHMFSLSLEDKWESILVSLLASWELCKILAVVKITSLVSLVVISWK